MARHIRIRGRSSAGVQYSIETSLPGRLQQTQRTAVDDYSKPEKKTDFGLSEHTSEVMRFSGPNVKGTKRKKTPGAVNMAGAPGPAPSSGGAATTASIKVSSDAGLSRLILPQTGHKQYEGFFNGHRVLIRSEDVIERGSFPSNKRQKREPRWVVKVDGQEVGSAPRLRDARAIAFDACITGKSVEAHRRSAGSISFQDSEGGEGTTYIEQVRIGDRIRVTRDLEVDSDDGKVQLRAGTLGEVQLVSPTNPSLRVLATTHQVKSKSTSVRRRSVEVPADAVQLQLSSDDPRV